MKSFVVALLALASFACAASPASTRNTAYGYLVDIGIPEAERIRQAEEKYLASRIVGGVPATLGQYPYHAGLLIDIIGITDGRRGICGGSMISENRVVTAAHCWFDGRNRGWRMTVVLGSNTLFTDGTRVETGIVVLHPNWNALFVRNDVGVIYLPNPIASSSTIAPIALPSGSELSNDYAGAAAIASGFGLTQDGGNIPLYQVLNHVRLNVISNSVCSVAFPQIVQDTNICTSGIGGVGTCNGDSGGPLVVNQNGRYILIGVTSFGSAFGCQANFPAAFARVTSFVDFFNEHL